MDINKLATSIWKLRNWLNSTNIDKKTQPDKALKILESMLNEENVEVFDYTGKEFNSGLAVEVLDNISTNKEETNFIVQTLKPIITIDGKVSQLGQVVLGNDVSNLNYIDDLKQKVDETRKKKTKRINLVFYLLVLLVIIFGAFGIVQLNQSRKDKETISNLYNNIANLENENSSLTKSINELENQIDNLENRNENSSNNEFILHKVVKGESLTEILKKYNLEYSKYIKDVKLLNNISNIDVIKEGSIIVLPNKEN